MIKLIEFRKNTKNHSAIYYVMIIQFGVYFSIPLLKYVPSYLCLFSSFEKILT